MNWQQLKKIVAFYGRFTLSFTQVGYRARRVFWPKFTPNFRGQHWLVTGGSGGLGRQMVLEDGEVVPYRDWRVNDERLLQPSLLTVPTGKDGICYRLSQLDWRVRDVERALAIAGHADDLWFKTHTLLTETPSLLLHHNMSQQFVELSSQGVALKRGVPGQLIGQTLFLSINKRGGNDVVFADCLNYLRQQMGGEPVMGRVAFPSAGCFV